jgi:hypothetical protein
LYCDGKVKVTKGKHSKVEVTTDDFIY